jgi:Rnl2 family RNA ligase
MTKFKKYPSIENSYRTKTIHYIEEYGYNSNNIEWVVLNKVHGANFSITMESHDSYLFGKRTSFLNDNDHNFCNYKNVFDNRMLNKLSAAYEYLLMSTGLTKGTVTFCGEIAGGDYPHPDVKKDVNAIKVQKGVYYAPFNFFYLFDILIDDKFISHNLVEKIGLMFGFVYAEPLMKGTFAECLEYKNDIKDPIHKIFNLPEITEGSCYKDTDKIIGTITEGLVIKPNQSLFFGNGSRVILKNKNEYFSESTKKKKTPRKPFEWSVEGAKIYSILSTYITENRLKNVLSHGHVIGQKDFGKLMGLMSKDTWNDFIKDHKDSFKCLEGKEQKRIKKSMNKWIADVIRPNFMNIIDGEF